MNETSQNGRIKRRDVMKAGLATGMGLAGLNAATGTVVAGETPDQLYFCGCSQVVVTGLSEDSSIDVYLAESGGCTVKTVSEPECHVGGTDPDLNYAFRYEFSPGEAILAVESPDGNVWCNPNNCAQQRISKTDPCDLQSNCTDLSELDPPGDVFTSGCGSVCDDG